MSWFPGRWVTLSAPRRLVIDLVRACRGAPIVTLERRMDLAELVAARAQWTPRPSWSAIFAHAFGAVVARTPALRSSYLPWPWPHLHEHPVPVATLTLEREYEGEEAVFLVHVRKPQAWRLADLDAYLRHCKHAPIDSISNFRRALRLARLPGLLRRAVFWLGLNGFGRLRERHFGTFGLSSVGAQGAGMLHLPLPLTATLHFGLLDDAGRLDVRLSFDHRVLDGAAGARALAALEEMLHGSVLEELRRPPALPTAA